MVVLQLEGLEEVLMTPRREKLKRYENFHKVTDLGRSFAFIQKNFLFNDAVQ